MLSSVSRWPIRGEKGGFPTFAARQLVHFYITESRNSMDNPAFKTLALQAMLTKITQIVSTLSSKNFTVADLLPDDRFQSYVITPLAATLFRQVISLSKGCAQLFRNIHSQGDLCSFLLDSLRFLSSPPPDLSPAVASDPRFQGLLSMRWQHIEITVGRMAVRELERLEHELLHHCFGRCFRLLQAELSPPHQGLKLHAASDQAPTLQMLPTMLESKIPAIVDAAFLFCKHSLQHPTNQSFILFIHIFSFILLFHRLHPR